MATSIIKSACAKTARQINASTRYSLGPCIKWALLLITCMLGLACGFVFSSSNSSSSELLMNGNALRDACEHLLLDQKANRMVMKIPEKNPLRAFCPQFVELIVYDGIEYFNIQISGGFSHQGILVVRNVCLIPPQNLPLSHFSKKHLGDGVFLYVE